MPTVALDASVAVAWILESENVPHGVREAAMAEGAIVPAIWHLEVANALLMAQRRGRISSSDRAAALFRLSRFPIEVDSETNTSAWAETYDLAVEHQLTLYDAAYLELAQRRALPLASLDGALRAGAAAAGIALLP